MGAAGIPKVTAAPRCFSRTKYEIGSTTTGLMSAKLLPLMPDAETLAGEAIPPALLGANRAAAGGAATAAAGAATVAADDDPAAGETRLVSSREQDAMPPDRELLVRDGGLVSELLLGSTAYLKPATSPSLN